MDNVLDIEQEQATFALLPQTEHGWGGFGDVARVHFSSESACMRLHFFLTRSTSEDAFRVPRTGPSLNATIAFISNSRR